MKQADIRGKWALVTGASRGIGRQICLGLREHGCNLVLHSRDVAHTEDLAAGLAASGVEVHQVAADLADQAQVDAMVSTVLSLEKGIDILYNNAAVATPFREEWKQVPAEDFRTCFEVNVISLVRICHAFLPGMIERGWGRIINVSSGIQDQPEMIAYALSKAAVDKFVTDTVGHLDGTGVLMNLLDPGWLRTDMGGPDATYPVESVLPGALVPALIDDGTTGQRIRAQDYAAS
jgi:NAD(P)-dependent dehydrogenase (short-subunit alcohol dehydrogenase family)